MSGFDAVVFSVSPAEYHDLVEQRGPPVERLKAGTPRQVPLAGEWSAVTMLLTGRLLSTSDPADEVLVGSQPLGECARAVPPSHVVRIAKELAELDDATLSRRLDALLNGVEDRVESNWGAEPLESRERLPELVRRVRALYAEAARLGHAVVVHSPLFEGEPAAAATQRRPIARA